MQFEELPGDVKFLENCILTNTEIKEYLNVNKTQTFQITKVDSLLRPIGLSGTSEELPGDVLITVVSMACIKIYVMVMCTKTLE